jgi:nucleoside-diphosphate-sugar epimerase
MRVPVTDSAEFIGGYLVERLLADGHQFARQPCWGSRSGGA